MTSNDDSEFRGQFNRDNASTRSKQSKKRMRDDRLLLQTTVEIDSQYSISTKSTSNQGHDGTHSELDEPTNMSKKKREEGFAGKPDEALTQKIVDSTSSSAEVQALDVEIREIPSSDLCSTTSMGNPDRQTQFNLEDFLITNNQEMKSRVPKETTGSVYPTHDQGIELGTGKHAELAQDTILHNIGETDNLERRAQFNRDNSSTKAKMNRRNEGKKSPVDSLRQNKNDSLNHFQPEKHKTNEGRIYAGSDTMSSTRSDYEKASQYNIDISFNGLEGVQTFQTVKPVLHEETNPVDQVGVQLHQSDDGKLTFQEQTTAPGKNIIFDDLESRGQFNRDNSSTKRLMDKRREDKTDVECTSHIQKTKIVIEENHRNIIGADDLERRGQFNRDNASTKIKQNRRDDAKKVQLSIPFEKSNSSNFSQVQMQSSAEKATNDDLSYNLLNTPFTGACFESTFINDNFSAESRLQPNEDEPKGGFLDSSNQETIKPATNVFHMIDLHLNKLNDQTLTPSSHCTKSFDDLDQTNQFNRDNSTTRKKQNLRTEYNGSVQAEPLMPKTTSSTPYLPTPIDEAVQCVETDEVVFSIPRNHTPNDEPIFRASFNIDISDTRAKQKLQEKDCLVVPDVPTMMIPAEPMNSSKILIHTPQTESVSKNSLSSHPTYNLSPQFEDERSAQFNRDNSATRAKQAQHEDDRKAKHKDFNQSDTTNIMDPIQTQRRSELIGSTNSVLSAQRNTLKIDYQDNRALDHPAKPNTAMRSGSAQTDSHYTRAEKQDSGEFFTIPYYNVSTGDTNKVQPSRNDPTTTLQQDRPRKTKPEMPEQVASHQKRLREPDNTGKLASGNRDRRSNVPQAQQRHRSDAGSRVSRNSLDREAQLRNVDYERHAQRQNLLCCVIL